MGLDVSHGCFSASYSYFMRWRRCIARTAGYPPLPLMQGFYRGLRIDDLNPRMQELMPDDGISWDLFKKDVLIELLHHSDCDGVLTAEIVGPLADRLEGLLGVMVSEVRDMHETTEKFIAGLRLAAAEDEDVEFC